MTARPDLDSFPAGRVIKVSNVGSVFIRHAAGPPGSPTVLLLHGWTSTADITWHGAFSALAARFSVVAPDLRGHGGGPTGPIAGLVDVARDVADLVVEMGLPPVIVAGYSLGGAVAQLLGRQRPELVAGLVLCASACCMAVTPPERARLWALRLVSHVAAILPDAMSATVADAVMGLLYGRDDYQRWVLGIARRHRWSTVLALGAALDRFDSRHWIGAVDLPAAVVLTAQDRFVPPERQRKLARALGAEPIVIDGGHAVCVTHPDRFAVSLVQACLQVASRGDVSTDPSERPPLVA